MPLHPPGERLSGPPPTSEPPTASAERATPTPVEARLRLYWWITFVVIIADQITKAIVRAELPLFGSITVIPGLVDLTHVQNAGVAFGLFNESDLPYQSLFTAVLALLALGGIAYYATHVRPEERLARLGLSLILGGAIGNLIDRLVIGYVIDFVDVYWRDWHFWAFNVADASISIGAILVFVELLLVKRTNAVSEPPERSGELGAPASDGDRGSGGQPPPGEG